LAKKRERNEKKMLPTKNTNYSGASYGPVSLAFAAATSCGKGEVPNYLHISLEI
jgi:hypothetical protein